MSIYLLLRRMLNRCIELLVVLVNLTCLRYLINLRLRNTTMSSLVVEVEDLGVPYVTLAFAKGFLYINLIASYHRGELLHTARKLLW
jgi:hypothetical protein